MKKIALWTILVVLCALTSGLSAQENSEPLAVDAVEVENAVVLEEADSATDTPVVEDAMLGAECEAPTVNLIGPFPGPRECGEPCSVPGEESGCVDRSGAVWKRVICYCTGGSWTC